MSKAGETFFTTVGCMDGRVQEPVANFGKKKFNAEFPDTITEAGLVGLLSLGVNRNPPPRWKELVKSIKEKITISLEKHHSKGIIVHGHCECAGNPIEDEVHRQDVLKSAEIIRSFVSESVEVIPVFVKREGGNWTVEEIEFEV